MSSVVRPDTTTGSRSAAAQDVAAYIPQLPLPAFARTSSSATARPPVAPPPALPSTVPLPSVVADSPASVSPLALDVGAVVDAPRRPAVAESTMQIILALTRVPRRIPKRRLGWVVAMALGASVLILALGVFRRMFFPDDAAVVVVVAPRPTATSAPAVASSAAPVSAPASLAPSPVGTVLGPVGRVYIDGTQVRGTSAVVPCGRHSIRVAPKRTTKSIDVPCGGELAVK